VGPRSVAPLELDPDEKEEEATVVVAGVDFTWVSATPIGRPLAELRLNNLSIEGLRSGIAKPTAPRISRFEPGTASEAAKATARYSLGATRQTAVTILPTLAGAAAAAALAIAAACLG
jgi:hypothetical protein